MNRQSSHCLANEMIKFTDEGKLVLLLMYLVNFAPLYVYTK